MKKVFLLLILLAVFTGCKKVYIDYDEVMLEQIKYLESKGCKVDFADKQCDVFNYNNYHFFVSKGKNKKENLFYGYTLVRIFEGDSINIDSKFAITP